MERDTMTVSSESLDPAAAEAAIERLVRRFYVKWEGDALLDPILRAVPDLEHHLQVIIDFWSRQLLGTLRYQGRPFPAHWALDLEPAHFDRWMALFCETAREELPEALATKAIGKAEQMNVAFQAGLFPLRGPDGRPMRMPRG